jgi:outer membrane protein assembly factor BamB
VTGRLTYFLLAFPLAAQISVTTYQYGNTRAGTNPYETVLTPSNVNVTQFGKLFSESTDGQAYAQPLYLASVRIGGAIHNVVYVATENDSVYAFDADNGQMLWHTSFLIHGATTVPYTDVSCNLLAPQIGITSTPVIDPSTHTIFVVAMTKEARTYVHRLHALNVATGAERPGSPVVIKASVPGTGDGGSTVTLVPRQYKQRPGLLLLHGVVYLGMSSHCDIRPYHGWLLGYDERTLQQVSVYNSTPNGEMGSFWAAGAAPAADDSGNIYVVSGNGTFDANSGGVDFGESFIKLNSSNLTVADSFTPFNAAALDKADLDTGSAGVALLGDEAGSPAHPHLMAGAGKEGRIYLIDRDNLGKWQSGLDAVVQSIPAAISGLYGNPAYFHQWVYFCTGADQLRAYPVSNATLGQPVIAPFFFTGFGCVPTVSANGISNGIVWALDPNSHSLLAFEASNVENLLWSSNRNAQRDAIDSAVKFTVPMVANGKVYVATNTALYAFGLL